MNSEAQRARNKRKRDKLREKRRQSRPSPILRFRLDGRGWYFSARERRPDEPVAVQICPGLPTDLILDPHWVEWSTEWVYMGTHEVSSSAADAITCFLNTIRDQNLYVDTIKLYMELNGTARRKVWRGHTVGARSVVKAVCSFVRQQSKEE